MCLASNKQQEDPEPGHAAASGLSPALTFNLATTLRQCRVRMDVAGTSGAPRARGVPDPRSLSCAGADPSPVPFVRDFVFTLPRVRVVWVGRSLLSR